MRAIGPTPRVLAEGTAQGGQDRFGLIAGERLQEGDHLLVMQELGGELSPWTAQTFALTIGAVPVDHSMLAPVAFVSHTWDCGAASWIGGALPGANVIIAGPAGVLGSGLATEGDARLPLTGNLPNPGTAIGATQGAPSGEAPLGGAAKTTKTTVASLGIPSKARLPKPMLAGAPPKGCDRSVLIGGVRDGADVTITHKSDGSSETHTWDRDRLWFSFAKPLPATGDDLSVTQAMPRCRRYRPSDPLHFHVAPAEPPGVLKISPMCAGSVLVHLEALVPDARVVIDVAGTHYLAMAPPTATAHTFQVDPLPSGATVVATQERCGLISNPGVATVADLPMTEPADLADPLVGCARAVRVLHAQPGALLEIRATGPAGTTSVSDRVFVTANSLRVSVSPYLHTGAKVWVSQLACSRPWADSPHHSVKATPHVDPPIIACPAIAGDAVVEVAAIPGAQVTVYAAHGEPPTIERLGAGLVDPVRQTVPLDRALRDSEHVFADQAICDQTSRPGPRTRVLANERTFSLPSPLQRTSGVGADPKAVVCDVASVTCHHDGTWRFTAHLTNHETEADCSVILAFEVDDPTPDHFGTSLDVDLSAAGDGRITKLGLRVLGVPAAKDFVRPGVFGPFRDPVYWSRVLGSTGTFRLAIVAFRTYPDLETDDAEESPSTPRP